MQESCIGREHSEAAAKRLVFRWSSRAGMRSPRTDGTGGVLRVSGLTRSTRRSPTWPLSWVDPEHQRDLPEISNCSELPTGDEPPFSWSRHRCRVFPRWRRRLDEQPGHDPIRLSRSPARCSTSCCRWWRCGCSHRTIGGNSIARLVTWVTVLLLRLRCRMSAVSATAGPGPLR